MPKNAIDRCEEEGARDTMLPVVNAFWKGDHLGPVHAACLRSWLAVGHRVVLHTYEPPRDVPAGIELFDAERLLPERRALLHRRSGSWALAAEIYRLEILAAGMGVYIDADVFCLKPLADRRFIFSGSQLLNSAVLKLPADSGCLHDLRAAASDPYFIAPWQKRRQRNVQRLARLIGLGRHIADAPWGTLGPRALTWYAKQHGLYGQALPSDYFYPLGMGQISRLLDPDLTIADITTSRTIAIHLHNEILKTLLTDPIPPTSPLGALLDMSGASRSDSKSERPIRSAQSC